MSQEYTSADTSINSVKLPAIFKKILAKGDIEQYSTRLLDIGCGKYTDHIKEYLGKDHIRYYGIDPYNKDHFDNYTTLKRFYEESYNDITLITCSNVLNVIKEASERIKLYDFMFDFLGLTPYTTAYITVYEGDKSGIGKETKPNCYQQNKPLSFYINEIKEYLAEDAKYYIFDKSNGMLRIQLVRL